MKSKADQLLIIGYGNCLRGDDGAGPRVARALRLRGFPAIAVHQLTPDLASYLGCVQLVIFVDADAELKPGQIRVTPVVQAAGSPFEHYASPGGVLRLAHEVYGRAPLALLIGIGGESYELGDKLSRPARLAVREAVNVCMTHGRSKRS